MRFSSTGNSALLIGESLLAENSVFAALSSLGLQVKFARSGYDGLEQLNSSHPAVVFLDYSIRDIEHSEVCTQIRLSEMHSSVPIICVFKHDPSFVEILNAYRCGADDCITGSSNATELIARVEWLMVRKQATASLRQYYSELRCRQTQTLGIVRETADLMDSIDVEYRSHANEFAGGSAHLFEERLEMGLGMIRSLASILEQQIDCFDISALIEQTEATNKISFKNDSSHCLGVASMEVAQL